MKIWISQDIDSGDYAMFDRKFTFGAYGPFEISNELYERIRESEQEVLSIQDILDSLVYDWKYPDDEPDEEMDCE